MFRKLRTDLFSELSPIKLLLVNAGGFSTNGNSSSSAIGLNGNTIGLLKDEGVECIAFSPKKSQDISSVAENLGIELHEGISDREEFYSKMKSEFSLLDHEIAIIARDGEDITMINRTSFSAVTQDAPLNVKSSSYYPTYNNGSHAVEEIAELILKAKRYPDGWSE